MNRRSFACAFLAFAFAFTVGASSAKAETLEGTVKLISLTTNSGLLVGVDKKETPLTWDKEVKVTVDGKPGKIEDVKVDSKVKVTHENGKVSLFAVQK